MSNSRISAACSQPTVSVRMDRDTWRNGKQKRASESSARCGPLELRPRGTYSQDQDVSHKLGHSGETSGYGSNVLTALVRSPLSQPSLVRLHSESGPHCPLPPSLPSIFSTPVYPSLCSLFTYYIYSSLGRVFFCVYSDDYLHRNSSLPKSF